MRFSTGSHPVLRASRWHWVEEFCRPPRPQGWKINLRAGWEPAFKGQCGGRREGWLGVVSPGSTAWGPQLHPKVSVSVAPLAALFLALCPPGLVLWPPRGSVSYHRAWNMSLFAWTWGRQFHDLPLRILTELMFFARLWVQLGVKCWVQVCFPSDFFYYCIFFLQLTPLLLILW